MRALSGPAEGDLSEGTRVGRFLVLCDIDGRRHAVLAGAVQVACEQEDGDTVVFLPGGRAIRVGVPLATLLGWLDGRS